ncbi:hypothetical protein PLESTM_000276000, partial [Pleodorina starrii]
RGGERRSGPPHQQHCTGAEDAAVHPEVAAGASAEPLLGRAIQYQRAEAPAQGPALSGASRVCAV